MPKDIIVVGASAGGIEALRVLVGELPSDLSASIFVVAAHLARSPACWLTYSTAPGCCQP